METKKSNGSVRARSRGGGLTVRRRKDREPSGGVALLAHVLEGQHAAELRLLLDGEAEPAATGFNCETSERILHVPHSMAADEACAILLCRQAGIIREKLAAMDDASAAFTYATTFPRSELLDN
jgi:hypothetical protein